MTPADRRHYRCSVTVDRSKRKPGVSARQAIIDYLRLERGSVAEIAQLIGYSYQTVENNVAQLRREQHPVAKLVRDGRKRYPLTPSRPVAWHPVTAPQPVQRALPLHLRALQNQTALELAWRAAA